jgi:DNA methyltransferase 1-associated protein 1
LIERELTRKKYLLSLENRTPEQIAEEEALYIEIKRLEQNERKFKKERETLLRTLAGMDSGLPDIVEDDGVSLGITPDGKKKKKGTAMEIDSPATPSTSMGAVVRRPSFAKNAAHGIIILSIYSVCMFIKFVEDAQHCIVRTDVPTSAATKSAHQPAFLRSFKLPTPKAAIAPKVTLALSELGISQSRLVMPTRENIVQFESLLDATTALIEIKRLVDKADYDIKVSRNRLGLREKSQSVGDGEPKMENDDSMDIDYTQGDDIEEGDGRGESVVSGRSRKHVSGPSNQILK